ncbi:hypothetical protein AKJ09_04002 [Labilithrix luteola]|uniref:Uncharacterized protein n=1 Tax=Labilithrix luteola TaxID=1391654 RepID=A0A0K1PUY1_9BACT|nr:hypothetical protein AKJ09_04002 [Labilithrix luteola]
MKIRRHTNRDVGTSLGSRGSKRTGKRTEHQQSARPNGESPRASRDVRAFPSIARLHGVPQPT